MKGAAIAWAVDYGRITPLLAKAIQDIAAIGATFKANLIAWFADAANGIGDFFARRGIFEEVCVKDANGRTCLNRSQVDALLSGSAAAGASVLGGAESHGGSSADEIPTADESTVPHNSDDSATTATSTLDAVSATDNEPVADAPVDEGPDTQSVEDTPAEETTERPRIWNHPTTNEPADAPVAAEPEADPPVEVAPANDNSPAEPLPATGTE